MNISSLRKLGLEPLCDVSEERQLERVSNPSTAHFNLRFGLPAVPVLIEGVASGWRTATHWTWDLFESQLGDLCCIGGRCGDSTGYRRFSLREYIAYMRSCRDNDPYYLKDCKIHLGTSLQQDYSVPDYFMSWHRAYPEKLDRPDVALITPALSWLYIGARSTYTGIHRDVWNTSAWNAVVSGVKLWLFYAPSQAEYLYEGQVNPFAPDIRKFPYFNRARPFYCVQNPGEIVFTPAGWWHAVFNVEPGISLTENFINETNYRTVRKAFEDRRMLKHLQSFGDYLEGDRRTLWLSGTEGAEFAVL